MPDRTTAQRAADNRYEEKRKGIPRPGTRVLVTLTDLEAAALDARLGPGQSRQDWIRAAIRRP